MRSSLPERVNSGEGVVISKCRRSRNFSKRGGKMRQRTSLVVLLTAITVGCIHKQSGPVSPWERVNVNLAALAQINDDIAKGVIAVQQAGTITVQQAAPVLNYQETVAKDHIALENILAAGSAQASSQSAEIQALLNENQKSGDGADSVGRTRGEKSKEPADVCAGLAGNRQPG